MCKNITIVYKSSEGDLLMMGSGNEHASYDMVWQSAASKNKDGWTAGMTQDLLNYNQADYTFKTSGYQYFVKLQYLFSK